MRELIMCHRGDQRRSDAIRGDQRRTEERWEEASVASVATCIWDEINDGEVHPGRDCIWDEIDDGEVKDSGPLLKANSEPSSISVSSRARSTIAADERGSWGSN